MYIAFLMYSTSTIFLKIASEQSFLSPTYILCFVVVIIVLGIYAFLWQQVLKKISLSVAMSNKPITLIFTNMWAYIFWGEMISIKNIVGIIIVLFGIFIVVRSENEK